ncbi:hypothetical protein E2562_037362 [Oryza meyeriana var. granulata]|uniref:Uncharacterized protein n=1 Tax=Oryza meyeriana var. granulata TaxID=110450 RepID=A0A6G1ETT1_9ORYZ|nr:hypothetical protein E2562_037362 [Oryza meyeriana var. granulata]
MWAAWARACLLRDRDTRRKQRRQGAGQAPWTGRPVFLVARILGEDGMAIGAQAQKAVARAPWRGARLGVVPLGSGRIASHGWKSGIGARWEQRHRLAWRSGARESSSAAHQSGVACNRGF